jgi:Pentapeptide repeats (9 copies)/Pentapeptide repeats (8 copies)
LRNADLSNADLNKADMSCADLSYAKLTQANLSKVVCIEGTINGADLQDSNLYCANFQYSSFRDSLLQGANLSAGNFGEVDFTHADLRQANLKDAKMTDANFQSAQLQDAQLSGTFLTVSQRNGIEPQDMQWPLPATEFSKEKSGSAIRFNQPSHSPFIIEKPDPTQTVIQVSQPTQHKLQPTLTLYFSSPVDWIALAGSLKRINSNHEVPILNVYSIETQVDQSIIVQIGVAEGYNADEIRCQVLAEYEELRLVLSKTFRLNELSPFSSPLNQLLNLLIKNLL